MRTLIEEFDRQFRKLHERNVEFVNMVPADVRFLRPHEGPDLSPVLSIGENVLRSAAMVEIAFGGITTRLWDDPFEWTLQEELSTTEKILGYLEEVEATRIHGFTFFTSDDDLNRSIPAPREIRTIFSILLDSLAKAEHYQGRAFAGFQLIAGGKLPRL